MGQAKFFTCTQARATSSVLIKGYGGTFHEKISNTRDWWIFYFECTVIAESLVFTSFSFDEALECIVTCDSVTAAGDIHRI